MFDVSWTEILMVSVVMIIVVGPKELPRMLRTIGQYVGKMKQMASDFKMQLDDAVQEAGVDDIRDELKKNNPANDLRDALNPLEENFEEDFKRLSSDEDFDDPAVEWDEEDEQPHEVVTAKKDADKSGQHESGKTETGKTGTGKHNKVTDRPAADKSERTVAQPAVSEQTNGVAPENIETTTGALNSGPLSRVEQDQKTAAMADK